MLANAQYGRAVPTGSLDKSIEYLKNAVALNSTGRFPVGTARSYNATKHGHWFVLG